MKNWREMYYALDAQFPRVRVIRPRQNMGGHCFNTGTILRISNRYRDYGGDDIRYKIDLTDGKNQITGVCEDSVVSVTELDDTIEENNRIQIAKHFNSWINK